MKFSNEQVIFRQAVANDYNFIKDSWLKSSRGNPEFRYVKDEFFYPNQTLVVERILFNARVYVAAFAEDTSVIIGYIIFDNTSNMHSDHLVVHWASVKKTFRRMGIYTYMLKNVLDLIGEEINKYYFTHLPQDKNAFIVQKEFKRIGLLYNPYLRNKYEA